MAWCWHILGQPIAKARPRVVLARSGGARGITPRRTAAWEAEAAWVLTTGWRETDGGHRPPLDELVQLDVVAVFARPKSLLGRGHTDGRLPHGKRPDGDNVLKAVEDALIKGGVLRDDSLVWRATVSKVYAARDEGPRVEVCLQRLSDALPAGAEVFPPSPPLRLVPRKG